MGESPADGDHRRSAARQACRRVGVGGRPCTPERRDLWRDLLPLVIALGPIDEAVRRGIGRASHPRASLGKCPELMGWCINCVDHLHSLECISMDSRGPSTKLIHGPCQISLVTATLPAALEPPASLGIKTFREPAIDL